MCSRRMWFADLRAAVSPLSHRVSGPVVHRRIASSKMMSHDLQADTVKAAALLLI